MKIYYSASNQRVRSVPYFGWLRKEMNPVWGAISFGPFGYIFWIRPDAN